MGPPVIRGGLACRRWHGAGLAAPPRVRPPCGRCTSSSAAWLAPDLAAPGRAAYCLSRGGKPQRQQGWTFASPCAGWRRAGPVQQTARCASVLIAEEGWVPPGSPRDADGVAIGLGEAAVGSAQTRNKAVAARRRGREFFAMPDERYAMPDEYRELYLEYLQGNASAEEPAESSAMARLDEEKEQVEVVPEADRRRQLWKGCRRAAKKRLGVEPDANAWQLHRAKLHESLWIEELNLLVTLGHLRMRVDDISDVGDLYILDISDLSDSLPVPLEESGLLRGLELVIQCSRGKEFRGRIQPRSSSGKIFFHADAELATARGPFEVAFRPLRFPELAKHQALDVRQVENVVGASLLDSDGKLPAASAEITHQLDSAAEALPTKLNWCQRRAVAGALQMGATHPLVVWGPPGSGKSTLAAFIVWQLVQQYPTELHILVAAPSNTAADLLSAKLAKLGIGREQMLRLNALGRSVATSPPDLLPYCATKISEGRRVFDVPSFEQVNKYKVVVSTCICAAHLSVKLRLAGGRAGWFSHVLVDEAGQATEPETMIPVSLLQPVAGRVLLLGDHLQLGPLVLSALAAKLGNLDVSLIERLVMERFRVAKEGGTATEDLADHTLEECEAMGLFFLPQTYRSHKAIMSLYSRMFYTNMLEHEVRQEQSSMLPFFAAKGLDAPVLFHNVVGEERRDPNNPSVYNIEEVRIITKYLLEMFRDNKLDVKASDVGVITPYARQVREFEQQFRTQGPPLSEVECGTVERFQGQEKSVVLLSTVRCSGGTGSSKSKDDNSPATATAEDAAARRPIGFLEQPQRLNVAISRAVAGLVIVGDLQLLALNSAKWRQLVEFGRDMDSLRGAPMGLRGSPAHVLGGSTAGVEMQHRSVPSAESTAAWDALVTT